MRVCTGAAAYRRSVASIAPRFFTALLLAQWRALLLAVKRWAAPQVLGWARLPVVTALFVYAFALLVGGLSFLPGGLGSHEVAMIGLLSLRSLPEAAAITATLWFALALGAVFLARQKTMGSES